MARLTKEAPQEKQSTTAQRPNRGTVVDACRHLLMHRRRDPDFAREFVHAIAAKESPFEAPHMVSVIGGGSRWEYQYQNRVLYSLHVYLGMSPDEIDLLHAGIEEGVGWRGEPIAQYLDIVNEAMRRTDAGADKYREQVRQSIQRFEERNR